MFEDDITFVYKLWCDSNSISGNILTCANRETFVCIKIAYVLINSRSADSQLSSLYENFIHTHMVSTEKKTGTKRSDGSAQNYYQLEHPRTPLSAKWLQPHVQFCVPTTHMNELPRIVQSGCSNRTRRKSSLYFSYSWRLGSLVSLHLSSTSLQFRRLSRGIVSNLRSEKCLVISP